VLSKNNNLNPVDLKLVIFDLDGTLLDTTDEIHYIFNKVLTVNNLPLQSKKYYKDNIGNGIDHLLTKILPKDFTGNYKSILSQAKELYSKYLNKKAKPFDGIYDVLNLLSEKNISIGIVTNKIHTLAERCVELFFNKYNIITIGAEFLYPKKPAPDSALFLANKFNFQPANILFIGDSQIDIFTAKNAKMLSAGVLWGNGSEEELENAGAGIIFAEPLDLKTYLMDQLN
jgi:phosphoglycolate phosphatase